MPGSGRAHPSFWTMATFPDILCPVGGVGWVWLDPSIETGSESRMNWNAFLYGGFLCTCVCVMCVCVCVCIVVWVRA